MYYLQLHTLWYHMIISDMYVYTMCAKQWNLHHIHIIHELFNSHVGGMHYCVCMRYMYMYLPMIIVSYGNSCVHACCHVHVNVPYNYNKPGAEVCICMYTTETALFLRKCLGCVVLCYFAFLFV